VRVMFLKLSVEMNLKNSMHSYFLYSLYVVGMYDALSY
jgi:hypothetical protein